MNFRRNFVQTRLSLRSIIGIKTESMAASEMLDIVKM